MAAGSIDLIDCWQRQTQEQADAVIAFWEREHANVEGERAQHRVQEVVVQAVDANGALAAVSTVEPRTIPRLGQPMWYYRCFVGVAWRDRKLPRPLLRRSFEVLENWSRERGFPCIGVLLELENPGFAHTLQRAWWPATQFVFIGRSMHGLDLRVRYFRGARLKPHQ